MVFRRRRVGDLARVERRGEERQRDQDEERAEYERSAVAAEAPE
jgi:hypothetical protein